MPEKSNEQLQKENSELRNKLNDLQMQFNELLKKVQTYLDAQQMQKQGFLSQLSEKVQELNKIFSQDNMNMQ